VRTCLFQISISYQYHSVADVTLSRWLVADVNSILWLSHLTVVGDGAEVSEVQAASIFRVVVFPSHIFGTDA
jgi:hypothetical protein